MQDCILKPISSQRLEKAIIDALAERKKKLEEIENQRNQIATDIIQALVVTLSHYLNNYLMSLKGGLALIEENLAPDSSNTELLKITRETRASALSIQAVINALARSERLNLTAYSSSTVILAIESAIREELARLSVQLPEL